MAMYEPPRQQPPTHDPAHTHVPVAVDSGVHVHSDRASGTQIGMTFFAVAAILAVFFYGLNTQRIPIAGSESKQATAAASGEVTGTQTAPPSQAAKQEAQNTADQQAGNKTPKSNAPVTTGQAVNGPAAPPAPTNAQPAAQQPSSAGPNSPAAQGNAEPVQPRGAGK